MAAREQFFKAMKRQSHTFVPFEFILCPSLLAEFKKRTGREDYEAYYDFATRLLFVDHTGSKEQYRKYHKQVEGLDINDWGVGFRQGDSPDFHEMKHPMEQFETLEELFAYPYPHPVNDYDWDGFHSKVCQVREMDRIAVGYLEVTLFEMAWYLRGMDNFMVDMMMNRDLAEYLLEQITERRCVSARKMAEAGCDVLRLGDDVSTQLDMMMHPDMWRAFIKPRLRRVIEAAREVKPDILIFYHGDGNLQKIIPDLIEVGVEILNPVQPECIDPVKIKELYGDKLSFWGTVGTQTTMPFGTPEDVAEACRRMISKVGMGGGLLLAPTHVLEPEVPWDNLEAFVDTVRKYNTEGL